MHADEQGGVAGGGKEVATVAAREGGERDTPRRGGVSTNPQRGQR